MSATTFAASHHQSTPSASPSTTTTLMPRTQPNNRQDSARAAPIHERVTLAEQKQLDLVTESIDPLPAELRRILTEVARTGTCPWLSWNEQEGGGYEGERKKVSALNFFVTQRRSGSRSLTSPRKKGLRNGIHTRRRIGEGVSKTANNVGRKRARTSSTSTLSNTALSGAGSVGSRGTSGSEVEDSTQYECDSEGTSTTTNSEVSIGERRKRVTIRSAALSHQPTSKYKSLREAIGTALRLVLDHFFRFRGGYKLSPAETGRGVQAAGEKASGKNDLADGKAGNGLEGRTSSPRDAAAAGFATDIPRPIPLTPFKAFEDRRDRLLSMIGLPSSDGKSETDENKKMNRGRPARDGPPFTIQRLAEVLLAPERYYTQTHKLCNCLEKLLLVTSSINSFGGSTGGMTSQSRQEERELAALADERERLDSEERNRRLRRRLSSSSTDGGNEGNEKVQSGDDPKKADSDEKAALRSSMEAKAKASLRHKFDHSGVDPRASPAVETPDLRAIAASRSMTTSPPPPSLSNNSNLTSITPHSHMAGFVMHLAEQQHQLHDNSSEKKGMVVRAPSPIVFTPSEAAANNSMDSTILPNHGLHVLQMHHAAAMAGFGLGNSAPVDFVIDSGSPKGTAGIMTAVGNSSNADPDLEVDLGRSSASNSDVDSESDDISLDDSASDRSDGSDSGSVHHEPFTAARMMALSRKQQQQRLQQSRIQTLGDFRPPADSEYQSGDSIDSTLAEDSGGSDSSSSDLAD